MLTAVRVVVATAGLSCGLMLAALLAPSRPTDQEPWQTLGFETALDYEEVSNLQKLPGVTALTAKQEALLHKYLHLEAEARWCAASAVGNLYGPSPQDRFLKDAATLIVKEPTNFLIEIMLSKWISQGGIGNVKRMTLDENQIVRTVAARVISYEAKQKEVAR